MLIIKRCYEHNIRPDKHCTPLTLEADDVIDDLQYDDLTANEQKLCTNMHGHAQTENAQNSNQTAYAIKKILCG